DGLELDILGSGLRALLRFGRRTRSRPLVTLPFIGNGAVGMPVPAGVLVVVRLQSLAHLHDRKHAAHLHRAELPEAGHHWQRVIGRWHFHCTHLRHPARTHRHVTTADYARDLLAHLLEVDADIGFHVVAHRVHGVVGLVAVERPVAWHIGHEVVSTDRANRYVDGGLRPSRAFRHPATFGAGHREVVAVHMNGV